MALNLGAMGIYNWQQLVAKKQLAAKQHGVAVVHHVSQHFAPSIHHVAVHLAPVMHQSNFAGAVVHPALSFANGAWIPIALGIVANLVTGFGCMNYAKAKGRNALLGVFGALPPFGMIGLALVSILRDNSLSTSK